MILFVSSFKQGFQNKLAHVEGVWFLFLDVGSNPTISTKSQKTVNGLFFMHSLLVQFEICDARNNFLLFRRLCSLQIPSSLKLVKLQVRNKKALNFVQCFFSGGISFLQFFTAFLIVDGFMYAVCIYSFVLLLINSISP